jgi:hypothetical protein
MNEVYNSAKEWRKANYHKLKKYRGEWVIYTKDGVIAHHRDYRTMTGQIDLQKLDPSEYITERIYENEFVEPVKFLQCASEQSKSMNGSQNTKFA